MKLWWGNTHTINCNTQTVPKTRSLYHVRRTQAHVLRAPSTTIWPGSHIDVTLLRDLPPEGIVAIEPRSKCRYAEKMWPKPTIDSILHTIGQWIFLNATDSTSAFSQISLSRPTMKYCGTITPCAMGMPGSETTLEESLYRVLGDHIQAGFMSKLAEDLYCGGNSPDELLENWTKVLKVLLM